MKEPIRILHVLQRMEAGGTQALLMNIYRNIDRSKIQFDFLVEYPNKHFYDDEIVSLGGKIYYSNVRKDKNIFKFTKLLTNIIKENNYKILHMHTYSIGYFVLKTAKKCGVPVRIAHSHSNNMTNDYRKYLKKILQKLYPIYATDYMACSSDAGRYLFKNREFVVLKNAIDSKKFIFKKSIRDRVRNELKINDAFVVGHVGRFQPEKNHTFLIDVFYEIKKRKSNAKLLLVGNGDPNDNLIDKIKVMNLDNDVIILKNRSDVNELYQAMDVFIFPSLYEGLGIVAIESQAAGTPVIISNGVPDEAIVSPICIKMNLDDLCVNWANEVIKLSQHIYAHSDMHKYVVNSGYDIEETALKIEKYYSEKYYKKILK